MLLLWKRRDDSLNQPYGAKREKMGSGNSDTHREDEDCLGYPHATSDYG
jgi:hypothetical protein